MTCKAERIRGSSHELCPLCAGRGIANNMGAAVVCPRCEGKKRVPMVSVTTLDRSACKTCAEACDGRTYHAQRGKR